MEYCFAQMGKLASEASVSTCAPWRSRLWRCTTCCTSCALTRLMAPTSAPRVGGQAGMLGSPVEAWPAGQLHAGQNPASHALPITPMLIHARPFASQCLVCSALIVPCRACCAGEYNLRLGIMKELRPEMVATHQARPLAVLLHGSGCAARAWLRLLRQHTSPASVLCSLDLLFDRVTTLCLAAFC